MAELVIDTLCELQQADQELRRLEARKAAQDRAVRARAVQIEHLKEQIEAIRTEHHDLRVKINLKELEVREKRDAIERHKSQQMQIRDNRQFAALQNEIKFAELAIRKLEDDMLNDYEDLEALETRIAEAKAQLEREGVELEAVRKEAEAKKDAADAEIQACRRRRDEIAQTLPSAVVEQFNRIADRLDGEALAPVVRDEVEGTFVCGGCNMSVTQNTYVLLRGRTENLIICPNCTRILYAEDS